MLVRCAICSLAVTPDTSGRYASMAGFVQCKPALVEVEGKARWLNPDFLRVCAAFVPVLDLRG